MRDTRSGPVPLNHRTRLLAGSVSLLQFLASVATSWSVTSDPCPTNPKRQVSGVRPCPYQLDLSSALPLMASAE